MPSLSKVSTASEEVPFLLTILNQSPIPILAFEPLHNEQGTIRDFRVNFANEAALHLVGIPFSAMRTSSLLQEYPSAGPFGLVDRLIEVVESGSVIRDEIYIDYLGVWVDASVTPLGDGFVATLLDITTRKKAEAEREQQARRMEQILNASMNGIITCESIRESLPNGKPGAILDFRFLTVNQAALPSFDLVESPLGNTVLTLFPATKEYIGKCVQVVETGISLRFETSYRLGETDGWYDVAVAKLDDGFVLTFNDMTYLKRSEQSQQQQARLLESVFNTSMNQILAIRAVRGSDNSITDFQIETFNNALVKASGYTPEQLTGMSLHTLDTGLNASGVFDQYVSVCQTGEPQQGDFYYPTMNQWFNVSAACQDTDRLVVTLTDITDSQRAIRQIEQQAELVNSVLDGAINSIMAYEAIRNPQTGTIVDFEVIIANKAAEAYLETLGSDLIGKRLLALYPEEAEMGLMARYVATVETGQAFRTEAFYRESNTWIDLSGTKLGDGIVVTFTDVSTNKQVALELTRQAEFVSRLLDGSLNGVMSYDPIYDDTGTLVDLVILSANQAAERYLQLSGYELIGKNLLKLYPQNVEMGLFAMYKRVLATKQAERMEAYLLDDNGETWLDTLATPRDEEGLVISFMDITERKKAQRQTDALVIELQKSNANLEQFAYIASHDLQEPLRKVMAFGDILQSQYATELSETGVDMIRRMQSAVQRMQTLIQDLLMFSRVASNNDELRLVDLNAILADVLIDLDTVMMKTGARTTIDQLPIVTGNALQLHQLFQNLLSNALKFIRSGTTPLVEVTYHIIANKDLGSLKNNVLQRPAYHRIEVRDNGIGFDPKYADQIFQLFQRLHSRSQYTGTGIGLSIVQKVVENHSGYIQAVGRPGMGATFVILLPA